MKQLRNQTVRDDIIRMEEASQCRPGGMKIWQAFCDAENRPAELILPTGELTNREIAGFVWAWKAQGRIELKSDMPAGLNANGLEGCVTIRTDYIAALLAAREIPDFRFVIRA